MCKTDYALPAIANAEMSTKEQRELLITAKATAEIVCCALGSGSGGGDRPVGADSLISLIEAIKQSLRDSELG